MNKEEGGTTDQEQRHHEQLQQVNDDVTAEVQSNTRNGGGTQEDDKQESTEPLESDTLLNKNVLNTTGSGEDKDATAVVKGGDKGVMAEKNGGHVGNGKEISGGKEINGKEICVEMEENGDATTKISPEEEEEKESGKRRACDLRCIVIGLLVIIIMVGGASVAILAHRFKAVETNHEFHFASYYMDDMILQRSPHRAVVWGYGPLISENMSVTVSLYRSTNPNADVPGRCNEDTTDLVQRHSASINRNIVVGQVWRVVLDAVSEVGLFTLRADLMIEGQPCSSYDHSQSLSLQRIMFGDVWLCAGQDNMQMSVDMVKDGEEDLKKVETEDRDLPIRLFSLLPARSHLPWYNIRGVQLPWSKPSRGALSGNRIAEGQIASHFSALCWLFGRHLQSQLQYPVGLVSITYAASDIDDWMPAAAHESCGQRAVTVHGQSTGYGQSTGLSSIWNAMVNPLLDMSMFGLIWYQGEEDALIGGGYNYNCSLIELVKHWREETYHRTLSSTSQHFPIGIVQLAPHRNDTRLTYGYTDVRWKQTGNYGYLPNPSLPETFLAVTIDLGDPESRHGSMISRYKYEVAERLVNGALAVGYRRNDARYQGPLPARYNISRSLQTLSLYYNNTDLHLSGDSGFEVCCSTNQSLPCLSSFTKVSYALDREWVSAKIVSQNEDTITLSTSQCSTDTHVVALRYAWRESPCEARVRGCAVYGAGDGGALPMPPYIRVGLKDDGIVRSLGLSKVDLI